MRRRRGCKCRRCLLTLHAVPDERSDPGDTAEQREIQANGSGTVHISEANQRSDPSCHVGRDPDRSPLLLVSMARPQRDEAESDDSADEGDLAITLDADDPDAKDGDPGKERGQRYDEHARRSDTLRLSQLLQMHARNVHNARGDACKFRQLRRKRSF